ncbi:heat-inducible transcriptional repressor HrcA [Lachnospiraceae bacterium C1.1]|nr:heat-inducible transcriptional repressor HrcA [Lachnospiraceae bacterium C1.1]
MCMEMDERKTKILEAIIKNYLATGEPVGSRTISKLEGLKVSPATIRNEMSDLEEMGYILQPHTSSGRIPSDKGYRFYVDRMFLEKEKEVSDMKEMVVEKADQLSELLKHVSKLLAENTQYAAMVSSPQTHRNKLKFIQLSRIDDKSVLAVIVVEGNIIKNKIIPTAEEIDDDTILKLNLLLNTHLNGLSLEDINLGLITLIKERAGIHSEMIASVIDAVAEAIRADEDLEIYTSGTNNIFRYPELADNQKASEIISTLEEKKEFTELMKESLNESGDENSHAIQVYIGNESPIQSMKNCSVVTATYELEDGMKGMMSIIGPKRMDYEKVAKTLKTLQEQLDTLYKKKT